MQILDKKRVRPPAESPMRQHSAPLDLQRSYGDQSHPLDQDSCPTEARARVSPNAALSPLLIAPSENALQPLDEAMARSEPFGKSSIRVLPFSPPKTHSDALDPSTSPQARSQPSKESTICVLPLSPSNTPPESLDPPTPLQARSQPSDESSIYVTIHPNSNLEDKVLSEAGGIDSNTYLGPNKPKRSIQKPFWLKDFI
ncbi:hypothetical protein SESBI_33822 [Sesbania bispinosa]|nr:hypothetical protein SESBI_33822 [Sesbania bispinosa]